MSISPTRSELLKTKDRIKLAVKGHALLKKKQDVLIKEFLENISQFQVMKSAIQDQVGSTYKTLAMDIAYSGIYVSRSISYSTKKNYYIELSEKNLMGVKIPQMRFHKTNETHVEHFENSPQLAQAQREFTELLEDLIKLATLEQKIYALADEIKKTKRRVNSLEHIQIPKLQDLKKYISFVLDEQERENFTRLKSIKNRLAKKQEA